MNRLTIPAILLLVLAWLAVAPAQDETPPPPDAAAAADGASADDTARAAVRNIGAEGQNTCIECHTKMGGEMAQLVRDFQASVHREMDFSCTDCHGGDSTSMDIYQAKSPDAGFIGKPSRATIPFVCDRCHGDASVMKLYGNLRTDQLELYKTSTHGQALFEQGDTNVAVCTDCHTAHSILRVKNPNSAVYKKNIPYTCGNCHSDSGLMEVYGLPADIPEQYVASRHGQQLYENNDLGAPVCNDCHGNHGAVPPGIAHIQDVCGNCHLKTEKYYNNSAHAPAFEALGYKKCLTCHNQHALQKPTDDYLDATADANCVVCHTEDSEQYATIASMMNTIIAIREMEAEARELVEETEKTTHLSMHEMIPKVELLHTSLLTGRILQHSTDVEEMIANEAEAQERFDSIRAFTEKLIERAKFNKNVVAVLALLLIGFGLLVWLYRKLVLDVMYPWEEYGGPESH